MASGIAMSGVRLAYLRPSRSWPRARGAGGLGRSAAVFMMISEVTTATKLAALTRKHTPTPTVAMRTPPMAGPTARAAFTVTEFSVIALRSSSRPTISRTNACLAEFSKALFRPRMTARRQTSQNVTAPSTVSSPSTRAWQPMASCRTIISLRLSTRSATTPPYGARSRTGSVCSATTSPSLVLECVSTRTSQDCAVICIQVPASEIDWPAKYSR